MNPATSITWGEIGIDFRYWHTSVESSSSAGIPPTQTCLNCHSYLFSDSPMLELVQSSYASGEPMRWNRVHDLPDYVYFDHSIHVAKGVACVTCQGRVDFMPLTYQPETMFMQWRLDCHRHPEQ